MSVILQPIILHFMRDSGSNNKFDSYVPCIPKKNYIYRYMLSYLSMGRIGDKEKN